MRMKKIIIVVGVIVGIGMLFPLIMFGFLLGGGSGEPLPVPATEEKAYEYQFACSELGAPWDVVMLADVVRAYAAKEGDIESYNPIITALEFCKLKEDKYNLVTHINDDGTTEAEWVYEGTMYYKAADEILLYAGYNKNTLFYQKAAPLIVDIQKKAEEKGNDDTKYEVCLENFLEPQYPDVLEKYIELEEKDIDGVIELYEALYLPQLYGFTEGVYDSPIWAGGEVNLPDIVEGNVTREELLAVAVSLLNHPYLLGGKSAHKGAPSGPLDCSGYVDWVYMQCFGKTIAGGGGTSSQFYASEEIGESELKPGDLGFVKHPRDVKTGYNHIGIYIGEFGGKKAWIHCGGSSYGYEERPLGRVGISLESGSNSSNFISGGSFSPPMKGCNFIYYRRARFQFAGKSEEEDEDAA